MSNSISTDDTDVHSRRRAFGAGAAALALTAMAAPARSASPAAAATVPIVRARFQIGSDWTPTWELVNRIPFVRQIYNEGINLVLEADGSLLINTPGLYRVSLSVDWVAQQGKDIDLRKIGIRRKKVAAPTRARPESGKMIDTGDDFLASCDTPGSNPPQVVRFQGLWEPGLVTYGGMVTTTVTLPDKGIVKPGDIAFASHALVCDHGIGESATDALTVQAKVVANDTVRVAMSNPLMSAGVMVPSGVLNIMAMSTTATRGESADAWQVLHTPTERIEAGERIYAVVRSRSFGDFVQASRTTFLHIEKIG